jgi:hypothetical protein
MFPFTGPARWLQARHFHTRCRLPLGVGRRNRRARPFRYHANGLEVLEDRTLLSVSVTTGTNSITFTSDNQ